jgi:hypothetical protein
VAKVELRLRERDAVGLHAVVARRVAHQPAPAAADIEQLLARREPQLPADHVELVVLRLLERVVPVGKVRAGILHLGIEKQLVELVPQVVMKLNVVLVLALLHRSAADLIARKGVLRLDLLAPRKEKRPGALGQKRQRQPLHPRARLFDAGRFEKFDEVAAEHLDLPGRVLADEVVERRPAEERPDHAGSGDSHPQVGVHVGPEGDLRTVPQLDREPGLQRLGQPRENFARRGNLPIGRGICRNSKHAWHLLAQTEIDLRLASHPKGMGGGRIANLRMCGKFKQSLLAGGANGRSQLRLRRTTYDTSRYASCQSAERAT